MMELALIIGFVFGVLSMYALGHYGSKCYLNAVIKDHPMQASFMEYLDANPQLRFWQALANWSHCQIYAVPDNIVIEELAANVLTSYRFSDTWEWKDRQHPTVQEL